MTAPGRRRGSRTALLALLALAAAVPAAGTASAEATPAAAQLPANCSQAGAGGRVTCTFGFTGGPQTLDLPAGATAVRVVAVGGRGGLGSDGYQPYRDFGPVQRGARIDTALPDDVGGRRVYVMVGGNGGSYYEPSAGQGGFNGGGEALPKRPAADPTKPDGSSYGLGRPEAGGGGGASDVRTTAPSEPGSLESRLAVAGGGGGDAYLYASGAAGGDAGGRGYGENPGSPGTTVAGGRGGLADYRGDAGESSNNGSLGRGGDGYGGAPFNPVEPFTGGSGGGGGGGWFGGGGALALGARYKGGAGGGSSLVPDGGSASPTTDPPSVTVSYAPPTASAAIRLDPSTATVQAGSPQTYTVTDLAADGSVIGPRAGSYTLGITPDGACDATSCTPASAGPHTVSATAGTSTATASLTATAPPAPAPPTTANRADLSVALDGPATLRAGQSTTLRVTVSNGGPAEASSVGTAVTLANGLRVTSAPGGALARDGSGVAFLAPKVSAGRSQAYVVTVQADPRARGTLRVDAAVGSRTPDPKLADNLARRTITVSTR